MEAANHPLVEAVANPYQVAVVEAANQPLEEAVANPFLVVVVEVVRMAEMQSLIGIVRNLLNVVEVHCHL